MPASRMQNGTRKWLSVRMHFALAMKDMASFGSKNWTGANAIGCGDGVSISEDLAQCGEGIHFE